jgi:hypothetical protein
VADTLPAPDAQDVPVDLERVVVVYNQAMADSEPGSVANLGRYTLTNQSDGEGVSFADADYDPDTFTVVLGLRPNLQPLLPGTCYSLRVKSAVRNACNQMQDADVLVEFCTAPEGPGSGAETASLESGDVLNRATALLSREPVGRVPAWKPQAEPPRRALLRTVPSMVRQWLALLSG